LTTSLHCPRSGLCFVYTSVWDVDVVVVVAVGVIICVLTLVACNEAINEQLLRRALH